MKTYRNLSSSEIQQLEQQGCVCPCWKEVEVEENIDLKNIHNVYFSGKIQLAARCVIRNSSLHNCIVENHVFIANAYRIANYTIAENVKIENIGYLETNAVSTFGNGTRVAVLDETGSRNIPIFNLLTSQIAYLLCWWKKDTQAIETIEKLIEKYVAECQAKQGYVGRNTVIKNATSIYNVRIGENAIIDGTQRLENGSINSTKENPIYVGDGVIAKDFILSSGAKLTENAIIERCFVGANSEIGKQFSATDCLFFANCQAFHGEAVALFAGPATVTHHKSTLLIGAMLSMFNAGSGSNESNHMYKSGPIHYGVLDRGCKMASGSYIPWPSRAGAFSLILGKHENKFDTHNFPFSYIVSKEGKTFLLPGISLCKLGTYRDGNKWKKRDLRTKAQQTDIVEYELLNPYTVSQIIAGWKALKELLKIKSECYTLTNGICINANAAKRGLDLYQMALYIYLDKNRLSESKQLTQLASWIDLSGMIVTRENVEAFIKKATENSFANMQTLLNELQQINTSYAAEENTFAIQTACAMLNKEQLTAEDILAIQEQAKKAKTYRSQLVKEDAEKEFSETFRTNFGLEQGENARDSEFETLQKNININDIDNLLK